MDHDRFVMFLLCLCVLCICSDLSFLEQQLLLPDDDEKTDSCDIRSFCHCSLQFFNSLSYVERQLLSDPFDPLEEVSQPMEVQKPR